MKKLISLSIVALMICITSESFAQTFGVRGGLNLSNMLIKDDVDTYSDEFKMNPGFHLGVTADFPISDVISFETGLLLSTKGFKQDEKETFGSDTYELKTKANLLYLDIPLTAKAMFDLGGVKIYGNLGPYIGMGLSGKSKIEMTFNGETESEEETIEWGSDENESDIKRLDFGLTAGAGVVINAIQIGLSYGLGLANISPTTEGGSSAKNRVLGISVGYTFGGM